MWIRSQNKMVLVKVNELFVYSKDNVTIQNENYILGVYKTKERALEILNEIQNIISNCSYELIEGYDDKKYKTSVVYEMPLE